METQDKIHDPLFAELFRIALPQLKGYQSDLGHDTLRLASAVPGERYLWGVRTHGTEIRLLDDDPERRSTEMQHTIKRFADHRWYLLEITGIRQDGYCAGTVVPLTAAEAATPHDPLHHHDPRDLHGYIKPVQDDELTYHAQAARLRQLWQDGDAPFSDGSRPSDPYNPSDPYPDPFKEPL